MSEHTHGPWKVCGARESTCSCGLVWSEKLDCVVAAAISARDESYTCGEGISDPATLAANARLIAAAPDLLAALEALVDGCECPGGRHDHECTQARAAIARAKGTP